MKDILNQSGLGKKVAYKATYNPELLFAIPRESKRQEIGINQPIPFVGFDLWNHYEVSWLNQKGKPIVAVASLFYSCESPNIIESKSMKLYFNSFNNTQISDTESLKRTIEQDISIRIEAPVSVNITELNTAKDERFYVSMTGVCLDHLDIDCSIYTVNPTYLSTESSIVVEETLFSNLLKANCLVTNQPDWATVQIYYKGLKINHEGLLKYLISFRNHNEFHEQCIERIFMDIMRHCQPEKLAVYGRFTRRGGLDINAYRGTEVIDPLANNSRLIRQ